MKKDIENDIKFYKTVESLKNVTRFKHFVPLHESVSAHSHAATLLALDLITKYELNVNLDKVIKMLLVHDLPEAGMEYDFPADKLNANEHLKKEKLNLETKKIEYLSENFNKPYLKNLINEFNEKQTIEALFANFVDKLEASIHIISNNCNGFNCKQDYEFIINYIAKYSKPFPEVKSLVTAIQQEVMQIYFNKTGEKFNN